MELNESTLATYGPELFFGIALVLSIFLAYRRMNKAISFIEPQELKVVIDEKRDSLILDVTQREEYLQGHVPSALNVPLQELASRLKAVSGSLDSHKDEPVFLVCRTDRRSIAALRILKEAEFSNVTILKGGMIEWAAMKLPVEKGD
jgi:rhodanese-related sulfurtransferase